MGKTTLKKCLFLQHPPNERTQRVTAYIQHFPRGNNQYVAILDGSGEQSYQQFDISVSADCLMIILDHNASDSDKTVDQNRLDEQRNFLNQLRNKLEESNSLPKKGIKILMNKQDLWEKATSEEQKLLKDFCTEERKKWLSTDVDYAKPPISVDDHSNNKIDNIIEFVDQVSPLISEKRSNV